MKKNELKRETWLRKYRALLKGIHAKNDELRENFRALSEYNKKNDKLPPAAYKLGFAHPWGIVTASNSVTLESETSYILKIDDQGGVFFEYFYGHDSENWLLLLAESVTKLQKRGTAGRLYDSVMEDGLDAGEAVAAFKELFEGIHENILKVAASLPQEAPKKPREKKEWKMKN